MHTLLNREIGRIFLAERIAAATEVRRRRTCRATCRAVLRTTRAEALPR